MEILEKSVCKICSKLTIKLPEQRQWRRFGFLTMLFSSVCIADFEQVNISWVRSLSNNKRLSLNLQARIYQMLNYFMMEVLIIPVYWFALQITGLAFIW